MIGIGHILGSFRCDMMYTSRTNHTDGQKYGVAFHKVSGGPKVTDNVTSSLFVLRVIKNSGKLRHDIARKLSHSRSSSTMIDNFDHPFSCSKHESPILPQFKHLPPKINISRLKAQDRARKQQKQATWDTPLPQILPASRHALRGNLSAACCCRRLHRIRSEGTRDLRLHN
jgi:hypothetical protein